MVDAVQLVDPAIVGLHPHPVPSPQPQRHGGAVATLLDSTFKAGFTEGHPVLGVPVQLDVQHGVSGLGAVCEELGREHVDTWVRSREDPYRRVVVVAVVEDDVVELERAGCRGGLFTGAKLSEECNVSLFHLCRKRK